jgi:hypothetical protein
MPIRDWGGGRDLSGLFESLNDLFLDQVESARNRQTRKSEQDQAAEDAETYDKWVNGMLSDEAWLAYIEKRRTESAGDKQKLQQWTEAYNKHSRAIDDGQREAAYQRGDISIHDLISHYNERMTGAEVNSPEHRELQDRYFNLVDRRDADYIDEQSMAIIDRIERGQGSYTELLALYEGMLPKLRSTSPLRSQIMRQITNIRQIVDGVTGGRGGRGRGGGSSDESTASATVATANARITEMYRLGNVFVPTGESIVASVFDLFDVENTEKEILEAMKADSLYIEQMMEEWKENPNLAVLRTAFGQEIPNTPETRWAIHNQAIANYDFRASMMHAMGDPDGAAAVAGARSDYVENIMQRDNGIAANQMWSVHREIFNQDLNIASTMNDPRVSAEMFRRAGRTFSRAASRFISQNDRALPEFQLPDDMLEEMDYSRQWADLIQFAPTMSPEEILTQASMLVDARPEGYHMGREDLERLVGDTEGATGSGIVGQVAAREGYRATEDLRAGRPVEVEPWVYVARAGESQPRLVRQSQVAAYLGLDTDNWMEAVRPFAERINIKDRPAMVYREIAPMPSTMWYQDKKGRWVTSEKLREVGRDPAALAEAEYTPAPIPQLEGWGVITDSSGGRWYVDPADGQLYERLPFRGGITGANFDPGDLVGKDGKLNITRSQGAQGVVMGLGRGVSRKWAQNLAMDGVMSGEIDLELYHSRDVASGHVSFDPFSIFDVEGMFWSQADDAMRERARHLNAAGGRRIGDRTPEDPRRELASRNEMRRIARVRDWWERSRTLDAELADETGQIGRSRLDDPIGEAARMAGVRLAQRHRQIDEAPSAENQGAFNPNPLRPTRSPSAPVLKPVSIDDIRPIRQIEAPPLPSVRPIEPPEKPAYATNPVQTRTPVQRVSSNRRPTIR